MEGSAGFFQAAVFFECSLFLEDNEFLCYVGEVKDKSVSGHSTCEESRADSFAEFLF